MKRRMICFLVTLGIIASCFNCVLYAEDNDLAPAIGTENTEVLDPEPEGEDNSAEYSGEPDDSQTAQPDESAEPEAQEPDGAAPEGQEQAQEPEDGKEPENTQDENMPQEAPEKSKLYVRAVVNKAGSDGSGKVDPYIYYGQRLPDLNRLENGRPIYYHLESSSDGRAWEDMPYIPEGIYSSIDMYLVDGSGAKITSYSSDGSYDEPVVYGVSIAYAFGSGNRYEAGGVLYEFEQPHKFAVRGYRFSVIPYDPVRDTPNLAADAADGYTDEDGILKDNRLELVPTAIHGRFTISDSNSLDSGNVFKDSLLIENIPQAEKGRIEYYLRNEKENFDENGVPFNGAITRKMVYEYKYFGLPALSGTRLEKKKDAGDAYLNFFTFGIYSNVSVKLTVTAEGIVYDDTVTIALFDGEEQLGNAVSPVIEKEGDKYIYRADFDISHSGSEVRAMSLNVKIKSAALGLESGLMPLSLNGNGDPENKNVLVFDSVRPVVSVKYKKKGAVQDVSDGDFYGTDAIDDDGSICVIIDDPGGLSSIDIKDTDTGGRLPAGENGEYEMVYPIRDFECGRHTIAVSARDNAGNENEPFSYTFWVDTDKPEIALKCTAAAANGSWYGISALSEGRIEITASDSSGISDISITDNGEKLSAEVNDGKASLLLSDFSDGEHVIRVTASDNSGSVSDLISVAGAPEKTGSYTFSIDSTPPEGSISGVNEKYKDDSGRLWYDKDGAEIEIGIDEANFDSISITVNGEPVDANDIRISPDAKKASFRTKSFDVNGECLVECVMTDMAGNSSEPEGAAVYMDNDAPVIESVTVEKAGTVLDSILNVMSAGIYSNDDIRFAVNVSDGAGGCGVRGVNIKYGGRSYEMKEDGDNTYIYDIPCDSGVIESGVEFEVTDNLGHKSGGYPLVFDASDGTISTGNNHIMLEKNPPAVNFKGSTKAVDINSVKWYGAPNENRPDDYKIVINAADGRNESGLAEVVISNNGIELERRKYDQQNAVNFGDQFVLPISGFGGGKNTITVTAADNSGNRTEEKYEFVIDNEPPVISSAVVSLASDNKDQKLSVLPGGIFSNDKIRFTITAKDNENGCGIDEERVNIAYSGSGKWQMLSGGDGTYYYEIDCEPDSSLRSNVRFVVRDMVGNRAEFSAPISTAGENGKKTDTNYFVIDKTGPFIDFHKPELSASKDGWYSGSEMSRSDNSIRIRFGDTVSGVGRIIITDTIGGSSEELLNKDYSDMGKAVYEDEWSCPLSMLREGRHKLNVAVLSNSGNSCMEDHEFGIDSTEIAVSGASVSKADNNSGQTLNVLSYGMFSNGNVVFSVRAFEEGSGIEYARMIYRDGGAERSEEMVVIKARDGAYMCHCTVNIPDEKGLLDAELICFRLIDYAGNVTEYTGTIADEKYPNKKTDVYHLILEKEAPAAAVPGSYDPDGGGWFGLSATDDEKIIVRMKDAQSGIGSVKITDSFDDDTTALEGGSIDLSGENEIMYRNDELIMEFPLSDFRDGGHVIRAVVTDNAGNCNGDASYSFHIDTVKPDGTISIKDADSKEKIIDGNKWYDNKEVRLEVNITEKNFDRAEITSNGGIPKVYSRDTEGVTIDGDTVTIAVSSDDFDERNHCYAFSGNIYDLAGNCSGLNEVIFFVDHSGPVIDSTAVSVNAQKYPYGIFASEKVRFTITVSDERNDSGTDNDKVYMTYGSVRERMSHGSGNVYYCDLPVGELSDKGEVIEDKVGFEAYDRYGKSTKKFPAVTQSGSSVMTESENLMFENIKPELTVIWDEKSDGTVLSDGTYWYNRDHTVHISAYDADSGLKSVKVRATVNGKPVPGYENEGKEYYDFGKYSKDGRDNEKRDYTISTDSLFNRASCKNGRYEITVAVSDNSGNPAEERVIKYNVDKTKPAVRSIDFVTSSGESVKDVKDFINELEYGYYFKGELTANIKVVDEGESSGLDKVTCRFVPYENGAAGQAYTKEAKIRNGVASVAFERNFKGRIFVLAYDNVGNISEREVSPRALVLDAPEAHDSEKHITVEGLDGTFYHDTNGNDLYSGDVAVKVTMKDTKSGIQDFTYSLSSEKDDRLETPVIDIEKRYAPGDVIDGWKVEATDANLVTVISRTFSYTDNNDIRLFFAMTDRAGNRTERGDIGTFSVDTRDPRIDVAFSSPEGTGQYYRGTRTATITVYERNFDPSRITASIRNSSGPAPSVSFSSVSREEHVAVVTFGEGDYTFGITGADRCGRTAAVSYSGGNERQFHVDLTDPKVELGFSDFKSDRTVYNQDMNMSVEITEHNFDPSLVKIDITRDGMNVTSQYVSNGSWSNNGDRHTVELKFVSDKEKFLQDGVYSVSVSAGDASGRKADDVKSPKFEIDSSKPKLMSPADKSTLIHTKALEEDAAEAITFSDKNIDYIDCTVSSYKVLKSDAQNKIGYDVEINEKKIDKKDLSFQKNAGSMSFTLENSCFENDGIYEVRCVAHDTAGNESDPTIHTFVIQRDMDFLAYIPYSDMEAKTGRYKFDSVDTRPEDFDDVNIVAYVTGDNDVKITVGTESENSNFDVTQTNYLEYYINNDGNAVIDGNKNGDDRINGVVRYDMVLKKGYFSANFDGVEKSLLLKASAVPKELSDPETEETAQNVRGINLGYFKIDDIAPSGDYASEFKKLSWYSGFYGEKAKTVRLEGVSKDIDLSACEFKSNGEPVGKNIRCNNDAGTISFDIDEGTYDLSVTLYDKAGNSYIVPGVGEIYVGSFLGRWWYMFAIGGVVLAAAAAAFIIIMRRGRKKSGKK